MLLDVFASGLSAGMHRAPLPPFAMVSFINVRVCADTRRFVLAVLKLETVSR
jgi:hypothetical protein